MNYLEWNNIISENLFNSDKAGREVYLYLTKKEIIELGKQYLAEETEEDIWHDYISKIKNGLQGSPKQSPIIDKLTHTYEKWRMPGIKSIDGVELKFPPYIAYLVFFVLPLIDVEDNYNANNYYDRLDNFLKENGINQNLRNRLRDLEAIWKDLSYWTNITKNQELGSFHLRNFSHANWIYVGKVFSQCIFPPKAIKKLPELFLLAGMIPDSNYSLKQIQTYLLEFGSTILKLSNTVIDIIRLSDKNELGQSITETVYKEYIKWTGESHSVDETGILQTQKNDIISRIYSQFKLSTNLGKIEFSFRLKSTNEFPEDLCLNGHEIVEEKNGYSRTLKLPYKNTFELKDYFNKWVAKFPNKEIRLFTNAGLLQLSNDYWIETDTLSKLSWMYLLCKNSSADRIQQWLTNHCLEFKDETDYENLPDGYSLFKFLNPKEGLEGVAELTIIQEKYIQLASGLEVDFRTFTNDFLPEVEIINSDGTEEIYLEYKHSNEKVILNKLQPHLNKWLLPSNISLYADFYLRAKGEVFTENDRSYKIISSEGAALKLDESKLPKRDSFGRITDLEITSYSIGSNTVGLGSAKQLIYKHHFKSRNEDAIKEIYSPNYLNSKGNILLSFLTLKKTITAKEFYAAFEFLHLKYFENNNQTNSLNYTKLKKASLNFFDYLGYLDYEYQTKSIVVNPPQLIFIPSNKGRKVLLIGGRDLSLVNLILLTAPKHNLQVEITEQFVANENLLLPDAIIIKSFGQSQENYGERNLIEFAKELNIKFNPDELIQLGLQNFCSSINDYEEAIFRTNQTSITYENWARYNFNPETLRLDQSNGEDFDRSLSLLEYRLRPWEFYHGLWKDQKCYDVDKNWGKYLILKYYNRQAILKGNDKVAIPLDLPLPRLLAESIMLCSGIAPIIKSMNGINYRVYENIPSIFIDNLFRKLGQKTLINTSL